MELWVIETCVEGKWLRWAVGDLGRLKMEPSTLEYCVSLANKRFLSIVSQTSKRGPHPSRIRNINAEEEIPMSALGFW